MNPLYGLQYSLPKYISRWGRKWHVLWMSEMIKLPALRLLWRVHLFEICVCMLQPVRTHFKRFRFFNYCFVASCPNFNSAIPIITKDNIHELNPRTYSTTHGTVIQPSCNPGYRLVGVPEFECKNGAWDYPVKPYCTSKLLYSYFMSVWSTVQTITPRCRGRPDALSYEAEGNSA